MADEQANVVRLDQRGSRRLTMRESAIWYGLAGASYIALSIFRKWLLNWFVGPAWLVAFVWAGPALLDRVRRR
jgi:energy-converting hydrogenase Eha subunit G